LISALRLLPTLIQHDETLLADVVKLLETLSKQIRNREWLYPLKLDSGNESILRVKGKRRIRL
jgi:hypothetical protein